MHIYCQVNWVNIYYKIVKLTTFSTGIFLRLDNWDLTPFCETKANINSSNQQIDFFSDLDFVKVRNKYFIAIIIRRISKVKISKGRLETKIFPSHKNRQPNFGIISLITKSWTSLNMYTYSLNYGFSFIEFLDARGQSL